VVGTAVHTCCTYYAVLLTITSLDWYWYWYWYCRSAGRSLEPLRLTYARAHYSPRRSAGRHKLLRRTTCHLYLWYILAHTTVELLLAIMNGRCDAIRCDGKGDLAATARTRTHASLCEIEASANNQLNTQPISWMDPMGGRPTPHSTQTHREDIRAPVHRDATLFRITRSLITKEIKQLV